MDERVQRLGPLLAMQSGVVRRAQLVDLGFADHDVERMVRRKELVRVHAGVYVDHTGTLTWDQRSWAAVLACWPAALAGRSAQRSADLRQLEGPDDGRPIEIVVDWSRSLRAPRGVRLRRTRQFQGMVDWSQFPPRQRAEQWVLDLAVEADSELDAVAVIADAVGARQVRPEALSVALEVRPRVKGRKFMAAVVGDVAAGSCSALEHRYLHRVERAHGLPTASRQVCSSAKGLLYRDVEYAEYGVVVELDGRLHHSGIRNRDRDLDRDLDALLDGKLTVRLGWGQVFGRHCRTASRLGAVLRSRGWDGVLRRCHDCPPNGC